MARPIRVPLVIVSLLLAFCWSARAVTNGLALTPPMGWNDWNSYGCGISESDITNTAAVLVAKGMKAAGYQFVNIDDCGLSSRDDYGVAVANASKFPHGIKPVADYIHFLGLKQGVYSDRGTNTCSGLNSPGSYGHEYLDAMTYASWGGDYLKEDNCKVVPGSSALVDYGSMEDGLIRSGRSIVFCICGNGGNTQSKGFISWHPDIGNQWRTTSDIKNDFASMLSKIDPNSTTAYLAGPGRWNDPDMLEIGNGEFAGNLTAARTHFTMWCIMAAPLIAGNNVTTMSAGTLQILTNAEAIAVDQDAAGEQGVKVFDGGSSEVWSKPLGYDFTTRAVAFLNRDTNNPATITCYWTNLAFQAGTATVRDLWTHQDLGTFTNSFTATVPPYGAMLLKVVGAPLPVMSAGTNYLSDRPPIYAYTGSGTIVKDKSIGGGTLTLAGTTYVKGVGVNSRSGIEYDLGGVCTRFQAKIGIDDDVGSSGSVVFEIFADGTKIYDSGAMTGSAATKAVDLDMTGVRRLTLGVNDNDNGTTSDHADWANALVIATNAVQAPHAPTGLNASPGNAIQLTWNSVLAAITYNVKRAVVSGGPYVTITNVPLTTFSDSNVVGGVTYYYVVSAVSSFGESLDSAEVIASPCAAPAVPVNLIRGSGGISNIVIRWNAAAGATTYNVYRFTASTPPVLAASGVVANSFTDAPVSAATTNYYYVTSVNSCSQSGWSNFIGAVTPPAAPTGLTATPGNSQITLGWVTPVGGTTFNIKRSTTSGGPYTTIASGVSGPGYVDTSVANGTTYYYVVSALDIAGEGPNSTQAFAAPVVPAIAYWTNAITATPQNWNVNVNWTNSPVFPNSSGMDTFINADIVSSQTINLNQAVTVGSLTIGDPNGSASYTVNANGGSLAFSDGGSASLTQVAASKGDMLATSISLLTNLVVINNSANALVLAGNVSSAGPSLTVGSGTLQVGDGAANGSLGSVNVTDSTALVFNRSDNVTMSGVISGAGSVTQNGAGVLTLSGVNTFAGGVTIRNGTLKAGHGSALGSSAGSTVITNGGTLDLNGTNLTAEAVTVSGWGVSSNGAVVNTGSQQTSGLRNVTLAGDTAFGGASQWNPSANVNRWDIRAASTSSTNGCSLSTGGKPYKLVKTGGNQISMVAVCVDTNLGEIDIQQGLMGWETVTSGMGNPASNIIVRAGATLSFFNASTPWNKHFVLYGDGGHTNLYNWSGANVIVGPVQLNGNCVFWGGGTSLALYNVVSGPGSLVKSGTCVLYLAGANSYAGDTLVNAGALVLTNNGSIATSPVITINSGATLDAAQRNDATLAVGSGQRLTGGGAVNGNAVLGDGAMLAPGSGVGTMTFNNNLTLGGGSVTMMEINKSTATNDVAQVAGTVTYNGTLMITNAGTNVFLAGDSFKLFNAAGYNGAFTNIVPAIPALNLAWDTNGLAGGILGVVAQPTPKPRISSVRWSGNNLVLSASNGVSGWPVRLLASTNVALPLTNWTIIASNLFDGGGNFSITNAVGGAQQYYLLQLP